MLLFLFVKAEYVNDNSYLHQFRFDFFRFYIYTPCLKNTQCTCVKTLNRVLTCRQLCTFITPFYVVVLVFEMSFEKQISFKLNQ